MDTPIDHLLAKLFEPRGDRTVVDGVADAHHDAADQFGPHLHVENRRLAKHRADRFRDLAFKFIAERAGRRHFDAHQLSLVVQ